MEYSRNVDKTPTKQQINDPYGTLMNDKRSMLLGFKDNQPVYQIKNTTMTTKNIDMGNTKDDGPTAAAVNTSRVVNVRVDPKTQEKFIILNGKRIRMASLGETKAQNNQDTLSFRVKKTSLPHISAQADNGKLEKVDKTSQVNKDKLYAQKNMGNPLVDNKETDDSTVVVIKCKNLNCELANKLKDPKHSKTTSLTEFDNIDTPKIELLASNVIVKDSKMLKTKNVATTVDCSVETDITTEHMDVLLKKMIAISSDKEVQTDIQIDPKKKVHENNLECYSPFEEFAACLSPRGLEELLNIPCEIDPISAVSKPDKSNMEKNFFKELHAALIADEKGNLPIHQAVIMDDLKRVKKCACILRALNLQGYIDLHNTDQLTPLCLSVMHGANTEIISFLLSEGAKLNSADSEGNTVLHLAIEFQRKDALEILLCYKGPDFNLNAVNHKGITPLIMCCIGGEYSCADLLLQHGADPNVKDGNSGRTALFHAVETENEELVELLMKYGADTKEKNFFGTSPHDAMFEIEVSETMRKLILCKTSRKRMADAAALRGTVISDRLPPLSQARPQTQGIRLFFEGKKIRTYPSLKKIKKDDYNSYPVFFAK
nr:unnamed protein product [Callosobruchus chinensis]